MLNDLADLTGLKSKISLLGIWTIFILSVATLALAQNSELSMYEFNLNGLQFTVDKNNGVLLKLYSPVVGTVLKTSKERASMIDLAYPVEPFQPLRLGSKFSKNVKIDATENKVTLTWEPLGASRSLPISGQVSASVRFIADADGQSINMSCTIRNHSQDSVRQVMFPDFAGIVPFAGEQNTIFRTLAFTENMFELLKPKIEGVPFYAVGPFHRGNNWIEYPAGGYKEISRTPANWVDIGSLGGGISIFPRRWGTPEPKSSIMVHRSEIDGKLRLLYAHNLTIAPGTTWQSDEYCLTPHQHGWAKGVKPLRDWVRQNWQRQYPIPKHVKNGMGFRSVWISKGIPPDSQDVIFRYRDLPKLAQESIEHGLDEMVVWFWCPYLQLPITTLPALGSKQDLIDAVQECKKLGVNVTLFISVLYLASPSAERYGWTPDPKMSWTYHPELIPPFNPPYADWNRSVLADQSNSQWQADVLASCKEFIDCGLTSFVWDVFTAAPTEPNLFDLTDKIRRLASTRDANAVFAGEGRFDIENDSKYLDYSWNWNWYDYEDLRPYSSVFPAPRLNTNIDESPRTVKLCFADNTYMNIMPSPPDGINAADWIVNHPALSQALKQCAKLRKQFQIYFHTGKPIGDCILAEECPSAHISAFLLEDRVLMILMKDHGDDTVTFNGDLQPWLSSSSGSYQIKIYDQEGTLVKTKKHKAIFTETTEPLEDLEILLYEIFPI